MLSNDIIAYVGFLFGLGFTLGAGLIVCIGLGITSLQRKAFEKLRSR